MVNCVVLMEDALTVSLKVSTKISAVKSIENDTSDGEVVSGMKVSARLAE